MASFLFSVTQTPLFATNFAVDYPCKGFVRLVANGIGRLQRILDVRFRILRFPTHQENSLGGV